MRKKLSQPTPALVTKDDWLARLIDVKKRKYELREKIRSHFDRIKPNYLN